MSGERWVTETLHDGLRCAFRADEVIYEEETEHQHLVIFENVKFGRVMSLDGITQVTEKDEFVYHEMMSHVPILAHGNAKKVLIIGGGDGGVLREVLRHKTVEKCTMVEIDRSVVDMCVEYLPMISAGAFDDPRTDLVIADGAKFVAETGVLDLEPAVLFCQDWGGLIGLRLVAAMPSRFAAVVAANTGLPEGEPVSDAFNDWLTFSQSVPSLPVGAIIAAGCARPLSEGERAAYDAPFPDESYKAGARQFPTLVPVTPEHASVAENRQAWAALGRFEQPFVTAYSDGDPVTAGRDREFQARVPGARGQRHLTLPGGHFLQEDSPGEIADLLDSLAAEAARETA